MMNPALRMLCERLLTRAGYKVPPKPIPRKAIDYLKENRIDLLLVDIRMPEVDGFEVIQHANAPARCCNSDHDRSRHR
jgi:two-component system, cell cycle response regulator CpdR